MRISAAFFIRVSGNERQRKYIFMFLNMNSGRQWIYIVGHPKTAMCLDGDRWSHLNTRDYDTLL